MRVFTDAAATALSVGPRAGPIRRVYPMIDSLLMALTQVSTFRGRELLTRASGFFYAGDEGLFLVTSRHVVYDEPSGHFPDRIELELHIDPDNLTRSIGYSVPLYREGRGVWRGGGDAGGEIDVVAIALDRSALPRALAISAFTAAHLPGPDRVVEVGAALVIAGFPLGFHDTLHHLPVVRHAVVASAFGLRFQGQGFFLTDARTHRGTSGAPVVMRMDPDLPCALPWLLLGIHSSRMDMMSRDREQDESLGLNCAWYADVLTMLTSARAPGRAALAPMARGAGA